MAGKKSAIIDKGRLRITRSAKDYKAVLKGFKGMLRGCKEVPRIAKECQGLQRSAEDCKVVLRMPKD